MNQSVKIAIAILVGITVWFAGRSLVRGSLAVPQEQVHMEEEIIVPDALVQDVVAETHSVVIPLKGRTEPDKTVTVKAGTTGTVVQTPAREGAFVKAGTLLCGLDVEARAARLQEAEAMRDAANIDYEAARQLAAKGLAASNQVAAAKASLDAATAGVNAARVELSKTQIRAPFDGIFETRLAEAGDFLSPGQACGVLVDMTPVIVAAEIAETHSGHILPGMTATARLASGQTFPAEIRYVSRTASERTRTFRIEATLETGDTPVAAGVTAQLHVPTREVLATLITPGLLTLSDAGVLGVRIVESDNTVHFAPIEIVDEADTGAWVTGLPEQARIIALGQDYLDEGLTVNPVPVSGGAL